MCIRDSSRVMLAAVQGGYTLAAEGGEVRGAYRTRDKDLIRALAHALTHLCSGHIVLPHMDALGVALQRHFHVIVDEQRHTVLLAQGCLLYTSL